MTIQYVFVDLETTGLEPEVHQILEVGAIAVDERLEEIGRFSAVVNYPDLARDCGNGTMIVRPGEPDGFVREMHTKNWLWDACHRSHYCERHVDHQFWDWLVGIGVTRTRAAVMAGHSIHFDHGFLRRRMPVSAQLFSHRIMDFGALARFLVLAGLPVKPAPKESFPHRSLPDCEIELAEAREMMAMLKQMRVAT